LLNSDLLNSDLLNSDLLNSDLLNSDLLNSDLLNSELVSERQAARSPHGGLAVLRLEFTVRRRTNNFKHHVTELFD